MSCLYSICSHAFLLFPQSGRHKEMERLKTEDEVTAVKKGQGDTKQIRPDAAENE